MKRLITFAAVALISLSLQGKSALVVIAHGSPSDTWNNTVLELEKRLNRIEIPGICYKRVALMEFAQPNIQSVIQDCERHQIDTVFALPLFISPSGHSEDDIPNLLGLKYNPKVRRELAAEGAGLVRTQMHIIVGPTLMESGILEKAIARRVKALSVNPQKEAVVLLAHGDPNRDGFWKTIMNNCSNAIKADGFTFVDYQLIGMGQNFTGDVMPVLASARNSRERIIVQGVYLVSNVGSMARMSGMQNGASGDIVFGEAGILPEGADDVLNWIVKTVEEWISEK